MKTMRKKPHRCRTQEPSLRIFSIPKGGYDKNKSNKNIIGKKQTKNPNKTISTWVKQTKTEEISDLGPINAKETHNSQDFEQIKFKGKENIVLTSGKENRLIAKLRRKGEAT